MVDEAELVAEVALHELEEGLGVRVLDGRAWKYSK